MLRSLSRRALVAILCSLTASVAYAQTPTASSVPNSSLPANGTATCLTYLSGIFNNDRILQKCIDPLRQVVNNYQTTRQSKGNTPDGSKSALETALDQMCSDSTAANCDLFAIKQTVHDFGDKCLDDLVNQNPGVVKLYDFFYLLTPLKGAICSRDISGQYCILTLANTGAVDQKKRSLPGLDEETSDHIVQTLNKLGGEVQSDEHASPQSKPETSLAKSEAEAERRVEKIYIERRQDPVNATFGNETEEQAGKDYLAFLFITPDSPDEILCGACLQGIMSGYIQFETISPYAIGLANSNMLSGQAALYAQAKKKCGGDWATKVNQEANTTAFADVSAAQRLVPLPGSGSKMAQWATLTAGSVALLAMTAY